MNYIKLLKHSYGVTISRGGCVPESPLEYLGDNIFDFTTYDREMSALFARKAIEVCNAITNLATIDYVKNRENYQWYLLMCNMPFFAGRVNWGTSIRGAWWNYEITFRPHALWRGDEQLLEDMKFTDGEWSRFMDAVSDFADGAISQPRP